MSGRLFIIGIDGVDISIARDQNLLLDDTVEWDLGDFPKLHTLRIWPSMYLGEPPHHNDNLPDPIAHSRSDRDSETLDRANWFDPRMRYLSKIANLVLPQEIRKHFGEQLEESRLGRSEPDQQDWPDTVFDSLLSKAINIPAYNPMQVQRDLKQGWRTRIAEGNAGIEELEVLAEKEREAVWSELEGALDRGYDLTWAYVYNPDIFGHVDYDYSYPTQVRKTWEAVVEPTLNRLDENDILAVITDHGMEKKGNVGEHRPPGWLTTTGSEVRLPQTPQDVRTWIETVVGTRSADKEEVLRDLGYI